MRRAAKIVLALAAGWAAIGLAACSGSEQIRVYVEPTYEQGRLLRLLARHPEVKLLIQPGTEDVSLRVEAVRDERAERHTRRATIRAHERRTGYVVYALAEFLPVRNTHGGRARWVNSYSDEIREDDVDEILFQVVREAARQEHRDHQRPPAEVERALLSATPTS